MDNHVFDIRRAILPDAQDCCDPLYTAETMSLKEAILRGITKAENVA